MTNTLQQLRQQSGLSMVDVATRTGIPVRDIAAAEHGLRTLDPQQLLLVSELYNVSNTRLLRVPKARNPSPYAWILGLGTVFILASAIVMLGGSMLVMSIPATRMLVDTRIVAQHHDDPAGSSTVLRQRLVQMALSPALSQQFMHLDNSETVEQPPAPVVDNSRPLAAIASKRGLPGAPFGCPVQPLHGQVVMTQGYGVGTHAPASIWGAVDLAVDSNGDGIADPADTTGAPIVALHAGIARVVPNNWLAGNYVRLTDSINGWATAYAHLSKLNIVSGQQVEPGDIIGWVGTTGYSSGPHLHYEVYQNDVNINPLSILECW